MRINEAYEHDALLPNPGVCCEKQGGHCVDIAAPVTMVPEVTVGTVTSACQGEPSVTCVTNADGASCTLTFTQRVCVSVPVCFGVTVTEGDPRIACGNSGKCCGLPNG